MAAVRWAALCTLLLAYSTPVALAQLKKVASPCTACSAVAAELQARIDSETTRNHLDMRHRLDATGKRYGKVIEYKASETRAVELLDGLCSVMKQWAVVEYNVGGSTAATQVWVRVKGDAVGDLTSAVRASSEEEDTHGKQLEAYCGSLLEEYEDEVYAGLMKGGFDTLGVEDEMCRKMITACPPREAPAPAPASEDNAPVVGAGAAPPQQEL